MDSKHINSEPQPEREKVPLKTLFELSESDKERLRSSFEANHGKGRMVVHPFFDVYVKEEGRLLVASLTPEEVERELLVAEMLKRALAHNTHHTPVFILEEATNMAKTQDIIRKMATVEPSPVFINSYYDHGFPLLTGHENREPWDLENWRAVNDILESLGAKEFIISGMRLKISENDFDFNLLDYYKRRHEKAKQLNQPKPKLDYSLDGCVAEAIEGLSQRFQVDFSFANVPSSRNDILSVERREMKP